MRAPAICQPFATVKLRTRVTKGAGKSAARMRSGTANSLLRASTHSLFHLSVVGQSGSLPRSTMVGRTALVSQVK
jgi:hypothetical protein